MLEKTLRLLEAYPPCAYAGDGATCFDDGEIAELGGVLARLVYAPSKLRRRIEEFGATVTRSDFYSEIPTVAEIERSTAAPGGLRLDACFADHAYLRAFLAELVPYAREFAPPAQPASELEFDWNNASFSYSDAAVYYAMIRRFKPATIVELGSGSSTLIASLACERNGRGRVVAVEPYAGVPAARLPNVTVVARRAQDLEPAFFEDLLQDGDFLFVDTTHTVKHDSDCLH
ncbi:MAG TPA: class I SAM-dependent methyltransferase, partial [Candidatus Elarobacter sp.]|nr:class I SAM-dependent methyltransferase [Candidatus Elarobacter sp.]